MLAGGTNFSLHFVMLRQRSMRVYFRDPEFRAYVGILGARYLLPVLSDAGYTDVAYAAVTQTDYPSWGYWIEQLGWTGLGEYFEATSRSRNHHFFGTPVQWMYEHLAGIRSLEPGYAKIEIRPEIPTDLDHVSASIRTVRGAVSVDWRKGPDGLALDVTVPPTATALVYLPTASPQQVAVEAGRFIGVESGRVAYEVGSGTYRFRVGGE